MVGPGFHLSGRRVEFLAGIGLQAHYELGQEIELMELSASCAGSIDAHSNVKGCFTSKASRMSYHTCASNLEDPCDKDI